jgi:hypothetical protein
MTKKTPKQARAPYWRWVRTVAERRKISIGESRKEIKKYQREGNFLRKKRGVLHTSPKVTWRKHKLSMGRNKNLPDAYRDYWLEI